MKIISNFKDYYDSYNYFGGADNSVVYVRKTNDIFNSNTMKNVSSNDIDFYNTKLIPKHRPLERQFYTKKEKKIFSPELNELVEIIPDLNPFCIGFCGKRYMGVSVAKIMKTLTSSILVSKEYCYSLEHLKNVMFAEFNYDYKKYLLYNDYYSYETWFSTPQYSDDVLKEIIKRKYVIFSYEKETTFKIIENPCLLNYGFQHILNGEQAYQEIEMWIANQLTEPHEPPVALPDKDRIKKHGFDKWSFRKKGVHSK